MRLEILRNASAFAALGPAWEELRTKTGERNPYQTYVWQWGVYEHFYRDTAADLAIVLAWDGPELRGILPLVRTRRPGRIPIRQLQFLAHPVLAMTGLDALGDREAKTFLWREALKKVGRLLPHDELVLSGLWESLPSVGGEDCAAGPLGTLKLRSLDVNPVFDLPGDWDACFNSFSANKRKELRRRERDLLKLGSLELEVASTPATVDALFPTLERLNQERFALAGIPGGLADERFARFHRDVGPKLAAMGKVRLFMLMASGEPIATLYVLVDGHRYIAYLGGHAASFDRFGPGTLIDSFMIRHAITVDGVKAIDFGPGAQAYKLRFEPRLLPLLEYRGTRRTLLGTALAGHRAVRARFAPARPAPEAACPAP